MNICLLLLLILFGYAQSLIPNPLIVVSAVGGSIFDNPTAVANYGFNTETEGGVGLCARFESLSPEIFPNNSSALSWLLNYQQEQHQSVNKWKEAKLAYIVEMDLIIWPKTLVTLFKDQVLDTKGRISIDQPKTLEILGLMFDELIQTFPTIDGFMFRVGETYLPSSPLFVGNGAIDFSLSFSEQQRQYIKLITFLRQRICVEHNKIVIFRTWDTSGFSPGDPARFHPNLEYYLNVTNNIPTHTNLVFSVKHTNLDFWRFLAWNPCLTQGKHQQIIEVECQREYEGKGAYPNYIGDGVINGFYEMPKIVGIKDVVSNPLIVGIWTWARGGGWFGPDIKAWEAWESLNTLVVAHYCIDELKLDPETIVIFRELSLFSSQAVLQMRYCTDYDKTLKGEYMPTNNWMRDDRFAGLPVLNPGDGHAWGDVFTYLLRNDLFDSVLTEKNGSTTLFAKIIDLANSMKVSPSQQDWKKQIVTQSQYGLYLSKIVYYAWEVMSLGFTGDMTGKYDIPLIRTSIANYDYAWNSYHGFLKANPLAATPYYGYYEGPTPEKDGLDTTINKYRTL
eukprot:TRINITY_DN6859_c0_g1_i2.p1 TRINITY_DN6859_c0_g1~~TRINITY_DN6859_c0_g1_i2.p1  ORF type:complete len:563 (-),score=97.94 TRINITY_DN6859_c0_g1_i2:18-1706(-)